MIQIAAFLFIVIVLAVTAPIWLFALAAVSNLLATVVITCLLVVAYGVGWLFWTDFKEGRRRRLGQ